MFQILIVKFFNFPFFGSFDLFRGARKLFFKEHCLFMTWIGFPVCSLVYIDVLKKKFCGGAANRQNRSSRSLDSRELTRIFGLFNQFI